MLNGVGSVQAGLYTFTEPAPDAVGISINGDAEHDALHTAYQGGMADWCGNCHGEFHSENTSNLVHTTNSLSGYAGFYNSYDGTGQPGSSTPYKAAVPFESSTMTTSYTGNAAGADHVMCMTCHRAHATSGPNAGRWEFGVTFLVEDGVESGSYAIPNPYALTAGDDQRSMCNKCHIKDVNNAPF